MIIWPTVVLRSADNGAPEGGGGSAPEGRGLGEAARQDAASAPTPPTGDTTPDWRESIPEDLRGEPVLSNISDVGDMAKQLVNINKAFGKDKLVKPGPDATLEQWEEFFLAVGKPEKPDGYDFTGLLPEGVDVGEERLKAFQEAFHKANLLPGQFKEVVSAYAQDLQAQVQAQQELVQKSVQDMSTTLKTEWGRDLESNLSVAEQAFEEHADDELKELVKTNPLVANNPALIKIFYQLGKLNAEDQVRQGQGSGGSHNTQSPGSVAQAKAMLESFLVEHQKAILDKSHPQHDWALRRRFELFRAANPASED